MLRLKLLGPSVCLIQVKGPNSVKSVPYTQSVLEINGSLRRVKTNESSTILGDFDEYVGNDAGVCGGVNRPT